MNCWIARDSDNELKMFTEKPVTIKINDEQYIWAKPRGKGFQSVLDKGLFPEVTFELSPTPAELNIVTMFKNN